MEVQEDVPVFASDELQTLNINMVEEGSQKQADQLSVVSTDSCQTGKELERGGDTDKKGETSKKRPKTLVPSLPLRTPEITKYLREEGLAEHRWRDVIWSDLNRQQHC